jgi:hypothetical protein
VHANGGCSHPSRRQSRGRQLRIMSTRMSTCGQLNPPATTVTTELRFSCAHLLETRATLASARHFVTLGDTLNSIRWVLHTHEVTGSSPVGPTWNESLAEPASAGFSFCDVDCDVRESKAAWSDG